MSLGPAEILVVALVALVVLGPEKLPQTARAAAKLFRECRDLLDQTRHKLIDALEVETDRDEKAAETEVDIRNGTSQAATKPDAVDKTVPDFTQFRPIVEQPVAEQSVVEQPVVEQPVVEQSVAEQPVVTQREPNQSPTSRVVESDQK